ncbi:hypothetical protein FQN49_007689 [Arthroderma sp. PD_2]|nr:hypothetical protein FQN49_007689 [Arthroderma sp. PD_2]
MDNLGQMIVDIANAVNVKKWLDRLPASPDHYATAEGMPASQAFTGADLMDRCHHPDCDFQVRLIPVHNHFHMGNRPSTLDFHPQPCSVSSRSSDTEATFWTAKTNQSRPETKSSIGLLMEDDLSDGNYSTDTSLSGETEVTERELREELIGKVLSAAIEEKGKEEDEGEVPRTKPEPRHTPFEMNLYQASWFHKVDLSEDACSIDEEDRDFLINKPLEASSRKQISQKLRKIRPSWLHRPTKSHHIAPKLRKWKQALATRLGGG